MQDTTHRRHGAFVHADMAGQVVLVRADFNVSLDADGQILDRYRVIEALPTIRALQDAGARVVLCSHLGRPDGTPDPRWSLRPVAACLSELLGEPISFADDCIGPSVEAAVAALQPGEVLLLENLRFHPGEEANDPAFARDLARLASYYVDEAFGTMHRAHASIVGVPAYLPSMPGLLVQREVERLAHVVEQPEAPLGLLLGGAKVKDKLPLIERLLPMAEVVCIGGAMATSIQRQRSGLTSIEHGGRSGDGRELQRICDLLEAAEESGAIELLLPTDVVASRTLAGQAAVTSTYVDRVPPGWDIRDIGSQTTRIFAAALAGCRTVLWNGPMGMFEEPTFARGSLRLATALAQSPARIVAGGGDTAAVARSAGVEDVFWHLSTGGGATLAFLAGEPMPGLDALTLPTRTVEGAGTGRAASSVPAS